MSYIECLILRVLFYTYNTAYTASLILYVLYTIYLFVLQDSVKLGAPHRRCSVAQPSRSWARICCRRWMVSSLWWHLMAKSCTSQRRPRCIWVSVRWVLGIICLIYAHKFSWRMALSGPSATCNCHLQVKGQASNGAEFAYPVLTNWHSASEQLALISFGFPFPLGRADGQLHI